MQRTTTGYRNWSWKWAQDL